jgi:hypothetical protein
MTPSLGRNGPKISSPSDCIDLGRKPIAGKRARADFVIPADYSRRRAKGSGVVGGVRHLDGAVATAESSPGKHDQIHGSGPEARLIAGAQPAAGSRAPNRSQGQLRQAQDQAGIGMGVGNSTAPK